MMIFFFLAGFLASSAGFFSSAADCFTSGAELPAPDPDAALVFSSVSPCLASNMSEPNLTAPSSNNNYTD
jgi:hypothetical protein